MVETAPYEVLRELGPVELRRYDSLVVARVQGQGDGSFRILFSYIQGNNEGRSKVAMTAPVLQDHQVGEGGGPVETIETTAPVIDDGDLMAFVMPSGMTLERAPRPLDRRVSMVRLPPRHLAVLRFSGRFTERAFRERSGQLLEAVAEAGLRTRGDPFSMLYNSPFALPFLRRNEVAVEVDVD